MKHRSFKNVFKKPFLKKEGGKITYAEHKQKGTNKKRSCKSKAVKLLTSCKISNMSMTAVLKMQYLQFERKTVRIQCSVGKEPFIFIPVYRGPKYAHIHSFEQDVKIHNHLSHTQKMMRNVTHLPNVFRRV